MAVDFRDVRDQRIKAIADSAERGGVPRDQAVKWAEERMAKAMPRVERTCVDEGKSRTIELNSK